MHKPSIIVAGNIGVGKSTAVQLLADELGLPAVSETHEQNPWLDRFYADRGRWAFHSQAYFLHQGLRQQRQAADSGGVHDQSVHEHFLVFAHQLRDEGVLSADEFALLSGLYYGMQDRITPPDLLVVLRDDPARLLPRAQASGDYGERITLPYLQGLEQRYQVLVDGWLACPVLEVDCRQLDLRAPEGAAGLVDQTLNVLG